MDRKIDELLFALMQNMTLSVSGEKLARELGVSHSTLVRWIEKLRAARVEIRGELFTGYRLTRVPDVLLPQVLRPGCGRIVLAETSTISILSTPPMHLLCASWGAGKPSPTGL
jgi:biotin operon repressor